MGSTAMPSRRVERVSDLLRSSLPRGEPLPPDVWHARHRGFVLFLFAQAVGLAIFGLLRNYGVLHAVLEASVVAIAAGASAVPGTSRRFRAVVVTLGLISASAILVHLSGGTIEAHFHFFVMVSLITLYQEWLPFLLAIAYVVLHHGLVGTIDPESVYNHPAAWNSPLKWALLHGAFVLAASVAGLLIWKRNEELRQREQMQAQLNRALDAFNSRVAHDLKTPLTAIRGAATTAKTMLENTDDVAALLGMIERQAGRAQELVVSLLALARASGTPEPTDIALPHFIEDLAVDVPHVAVELGSLPDEIEVDATGLRQVLTNLLNNAARYAREGDEPAHVTIWGTEEADGWTLVVADRGPGVPPEEAKAIFDPLTRGTNAHEGGAGLGLSIVKAVAEAHGGRVWYEPRPGGGSEFRLYFPRPPTVADIHRIELGEATG